MTETETKEATQEETAELLVELYSEEIPWRLQEPMARNLEKFLHEELTKALGLKNVEDVFGKARVYWTPRRVAVGIFDVPVRSRAWEEERRGPRVISPQVAIDGFLRANGLSRDECQQKEGYLTFVVKHAALSTSELLGDVVVRVIERISKALPVAMRFGAQTFRWARPLRHIMVVFAGTGVRGALELGNEENLPFTDKTRGHPIAAPEALVVAGIQDYEDKLRKNYVEPDYQKRYYDIRKNTWGDHAWFAQEKFYSDLSLFSEEIRLFRENACLTECPVVLKGYFDEGFNDLPSFLIDTVLGEHQKIIRDNAIEKTSSSENNFFVITNTPHAKEEGEEKNNITKGFERVVRARLADATFMLKRDQQTSIEELINRLKNITFHPKLGTIADKNQRTKKLIPILIETLKNNNDEFSLDKKYDSAWFEKRVDLLKMDLATETVREFPSLQKLICQKLTGEQFDNFYSQSYTIIDIADNIDTLVSLWSAGEKPTGSRDPFALRRCALVVMFYLNEGDALKNISLPLKNIIKSMLDILSIKNSEQDLMLREIVHFMFERCRVFLKDRKQMPPDYIEAVLTHNNAQECNIYLIYRHVTTLAKEINNNNPLTEIFYRLHAILRSYSDLISPPSPKLFSVSEEKNLHARTHQLLADEAWQNLTFQEKLQTLGNLKDAVDPFFEKVLVMHKEENIRQNRLRLLYNIYRRFLELADFTKIHHKDQQQKDKQRKQP